MRRIGRQIEQEKLPLGSLDKLFHCYSTMNRVTVYDEKYGAVCFHKQWFEETNKDRGGKLSLAAEKVAWYFGDA